MLVCFWIVHYFLRKLLWRTCSNNNFTHMTTLKYNELQSQTLKETPHKGCSLHPGDSHHLCYVKYIMLCKLSSKYDSLCLHQMRLMTCQAEVFLLFHDMFNAVAWITSNHYHFKNLCYKFEDVYSSNYESSSKGNIISNKSKFSV